CCVCFEVAVAGWRGALPPQKKQTPGQPPPPPAHPHTYIFNVAVNPIFFPKLKKKTKKKKKKKKK
ncbi:hypothetical protein, partial [Enterobacter hormaechei]